MLLKIQLRKIYFSLILFKPNLTGLPEALSKSNSPLHKLFQRLYWELRVQQSFTHYDSSHLSTKENSIKSKNAFHSRKTLNKK